MRKNSTDASAPSARFSISGVDICGNTSHEGGKKIKPFAKEDLLCKIESVEFAKYFIWAKGGWERILDVVNSY